MIDETTSEESLPTIISVSKTFHATSTNIARRIRMLILGI
jgi:hypothetical protein